MATPNMSAADLAELEKKLKRIEELSNKFNANINTLNLQPLEDNAGAIEAIWESLENRLDQAGKKTNYLVGSFKDLVDEIKNSKSGLADSTKSLKSLSSISEQLINHQKGYNELSSKDLSKLQNKVKIERDRLVDISQRLEDEAYELTLQKNSNNFTMMGVKEQQKILDKLDQTKAAQESINNLLSVEDVTLADLNTELGEELDLTKNIEKTLGLSEALMKGMSKIPFLGDLPGMSSILGDVKKEIKSINEKRKEEGKEPVSRAEALRITFSKMKGVVKNVLTDPLVYLGLMIKGFLSLDKAQTDFAREAGHTVDHFDTLNTSLISSSDYIKMAGALTKQMGMDATAIFSKGTLTEATELVELMGLSAEEAGRLAIYSKANGKELDKVNKSVFAQVANFNKINKTAISGKTILQDISKISDTLALNFGFDATKMAEAAANARKFGLELSQVDKIADSLLDFESSITNELSAELITGKQFNLERARLLALNNDLNGLTKEIGNNQQILTAFSSGNRIQQEQVAKMLGMQKDEVAKMIIAEK